MATLVDQNTPVVPSPTPKSASTAEILTQIKKKLSVSILRPLPVTHNSMSALPTLHRSDTEMSPQVEFLERKRSIRAPFQNLFNKPPFSPPLSDSADVLNPHSLRQRLSALPLSTEVPHFTQNYRTFSHHFSQKVPKVKSRTLGYHSLFHRHFDHHLDPESGGQDNEDEDEWDFRCQGVLPIVPRRHNRSSIQFLFTSSLEESPTATSNQSFGMTNSPSLVNTPLLDQLDECDDTHSDDHDFSQHNQQFQLNHHRRNSEKVYKFSPSRRSSVSTSSNPVSPQEITSFAVHSISAPPPTPAPTPTPL